MTKLAAELAPEGIMTLSLSPGWVDTDASKSLLMSQTRQKDRTDWLETAKTVTGDPEIHKAVLNMFHKVDATVEGPAPIEEAVTNMLRVIRNLIQADSGKFLTHHGDEEMWF